MLCKAKIYGSLSRKSPSLERLDLKPSFCSFLPFLKEIFKGCGELMLKILQKTLAIKICFAAGNNSRIIAMFIELNR